MRGNSHVRFGAGDEETCPGDGARRFIPTLPENPSALSLSGRCGVFPQKGSAETIGSAAGEGFPLRLPFLGALYLEAMAFDATGASLFLKMRWKGYFIPYMARFARQEGQFRLLFLRRLC